MLYEINVTQEDINNGAKKQCTMCPIALATKRVFPNSDWISVTPGFIRVCDEIFDEGVCYSIPDKARDFMESFDGGLKVFPFSFTVDSEKLF